MAGEEWGEVVDDVVVPAAHGRSFEARAGDHVVVTDIEGTQIVDFVAFNAHDHDEMLDTARTRSGLLPQRVEVAPGRVEQYWQTNVYLREGDEISSNQRNPILKLVKDASPGVHDMLFAPCDLRLYNDVYKYEGFHRNCLDNLTEALAPHGVQWWQIPAPINIFMNVPVQENGRIWAEPGVSRPGDYVVFRALQDLVGAASSCPWDLRPVNGAQVTPIRVTIRRPR
jgi:uncharacterized protein YcgI (DUF1989 family)